MYTSYVVNKPLLIMKTIVLRLRALLSLLLMLAFSSCMNPKQNSDLDSGFGSDHWLIGDWMYMSGKDTMIEQWSYLNAEELVCVNQKLKNGDSLPNETVSLRLVDKNYVFEVKVEDQNNGEGVPFTLKYRTEAKLVFENIEHDFPQQITYVLTHKDSCTASISGTINKQKHKIDFSLVRLPD